MKSRIAVHLQIFNTTYSRVSHDGRATARLVSRIGIARDTATLRGTIKGVLGIELVADFVSDEVDVKRIVDGIGNARHTACLVGVVTGPAEPGQASATGAEYVPDIVPGATEYGVNPDLVLIEQGLRVAVAETGVTIDFDQVVVVVNQLEKYPDVPLINIVDAVDRGDNRRLGLGPATTSAGARDINLFHVVVGRRYRDSILAQLVR